jgi:hypothetical protein
MIVTYNNLVSDIYYINVQGTLPVVMSYHILS